MKHVMEPKEVVYLNQRVRYQIQNGIFYINTEDVCIILNIQDRKSVSPSGLEFVPFNIAIGAAYDSKDNGFFYWLKQTFPTRSERDLDASSL